MPVFRNPQDLTWAQSIQPPWPNDYTGSRYAQLRTPEMTPDVQSNMPVYNPDQGLPPMDRPMAMPAGGQQAGILQELQRELMRRIAPAPVMPPGKFGSPYQAPGSPSTTMPYQTPTEAPVGRFGSPAPVVTEEEQPPTPVPMGRFGSPYQEGQPSSGPPTGIETSQPDSYPEGKYGSPSETVAILDALNRLVGGSRMSPESVREPGPSMQESAPMTPESVRAPGQSMPGQPQQPGAAPAGANTQGATAMIQQLVNQGRPAVPDVPQIDPMMYLEQYGRAKDRITKALHKEADFSDITQAMLAGSGSRGNYADALNALKAQKIKEQMAAYEMERDYARQGLDTYKITEDVKTSRAAREQATGKPQSDVGKLADDLKKGLITKEEYNTALEIKKKPLVQFEAAQNEKANKQQMQTEAAKGAAGIALRKVDEALSQVGPFTTGVMGSVLGLIPGSPAYDLRRTAETIKAIVGFEQLTAMRQASPTGGALGQIAVQELNFLQSSIASLDPNQSQAMLTANLEQIRQHYKNWLNAVSQAADTGETPGMPAAPPKVIDFNQLPPG